MALWIPPSVVGRKPAYECGVCGKPFFDNEQRAWISHTVACADNHADEIDQLRAAVRKWNEEVDPEWGAYNRQLEAKGLDPMVQYERRSKKSPKRSLRES